MRWASLNAVTHITIREYKQTVTQYRGSQRRSLHTGGLLVICGQRLMMCDIQGEVSFIMHHYD
jgi:hypothetical protein